MVIGHIVLLSRPRPPPPPPPPPNECSGSATAKCSSTYRVAVLHVLFSAHAHFAHVVVEQGRVHDDGTDFKNDFVLGRSRGQRLHGDPGVGRRTTAHHNTCQRYLEQYVIIPVVVVVV